MEMATAPKVSVITPAYNCAKYISQSVRSALAQTFSNLEVIVVDDGSSDDLLEQLTGLQDERLRLIRQVHGGPSASRNAGIEAARGTYIAFLDGDDAWMPTMLEKHIEFLDCRTDVDLTYSLSQLIDESGKEIGIPMPSRPGVVSFRQLLVENLARNGSAVVVRRHALLKAGAFDPAFLIFEDHDMWLRVAQLRPGNIYCLPHVLTLYRRHPHQLTRNRALVRAEWRRLIRKMCDATESDVRQVESLAASRMNYYLAWLAYEAGQPLNAVWPLCLSLRPPPWSRLFKPRSWLLGVACFSALVLPRSLHRRIELSATHWLRVTVHRFRGRMEA